MKSYLWPIFVLLVSMTGMAQTRNVSGIVYDAKTNAPLHLADIYINNSTISAVTNSSGEFILHNIPVGNVDMICSFVGYQVMQVKVPAGEQNHIQIRLVPDIAELKSVDVRGARDKVWERNVKKFQKIFLGEDDAAKECKIINPWVIDFTTSGDVLSATAVAPVEIENQALGYRIFFQLKSFSSNASSYSIIGNTRFVQLPGNNPTDVVKWLKNRERSYLGSERNLMKSIVDQKIHREGFLLYTETTPGKPRSNNFAFESRHNLVPYDTIGLVSRDPESPMLYKIAVKNKMEIQYLFGFTRGGFYADIDRPVSFLEVRGNSVTVDQDGLVYNPTDVTISGAMATRVADLLPMDYQPKNVAAITRSTTLSAKRMQEKTYFQTDKSYYYPGEILWMSGFMNYRAQGMLDTLSTVIYAELVSSGGVVSTAVLKLDGGRTDGAILLPAVPGTYWLRAYTNWMKNYGGGNLFYKSIPVLDQYDRPDVRPAAPAGTINPPLRVQFDKPAYQEGDDVKMVISLPDTGQVQRASLCVTVTDEFQAVPVEGSTDIRKDFPFAEELPKTTLTKFRFPVERGLSYDGNYFNKKGVTEKTKLTIIQDKFEDLFTVNTDDNGGFHLRDLNFTDSVAFAVQSGKGKVIIKSKEKAPAPVALPSFYVPVKRTEQNQSKAVIDTTKVKVLKEVGVTASKIYLNPNRGADYYLTQENFTGFINLATAIASATTMFRIGFQQGHNFLVYSRDYLNREPALFIDNNLVFLSTPETVGDRLSYLDVGTIDHVEINSATTSGQGANGSQGALYIYLKKADNSNFKSLPTFKLRGFDRARNFQAMIKNSLDNSVRATLFWDPRITLDREHKTISRDIITAGKAGSYRVIIEGVAGDGVPFRVEKQIRIE